MKTKKAEQLEAQIKEVIELLKGEDPRSKPNLIFLSDEGESTIHYSGRSEIVTLNEAVELHNIYPDVLVIHFKDLNS